jgi:uroporphyrinogen III methyltransferase/synthase
VRNIATGKVYLVGAGPGDPGLLTLRAKELLSRADAVVYDALIHPQILEFISPQAERIFRGHRAKKSALSQMQINQRLIQLAKAGYMTVRLKGGDPFVFGRGAEEILALVKAKIPFEVVPGVSSAIAVPAYAGIPVTHRDINSSLTIVTGHETPSKGNTQVDWKNLAENKGTLVFLMGLHSLKNVSEKLVTAGKNPKTPSAVIQRGTTPRQKTVVGTLGTIFKLTAKAKLIPPAILVVGDVVGLRSKVYWLQHKPLYGLRILMTRTRSQSSYLSGLMTEEGAEVIEIPTIDIHPLPMSRAAKTKVEKISEYDWIVLASPNAVDVFMNNLKQLNKSSLNISNVKIACVGESTAKTLSQYGLKADLVPKDYKQEGLIKAFQKLLVKDQKFLFASAKDGREILIHFLKRKGGLVDFWPIYENKIPFGTRERLVHLFQNEGGVDLLTFASSSSVDNFYGVFTPAERLKWLKKIPVAVIGPVTAASVKKWGGKVVVMPKKYTMPNLVKGLSHWAKRQKPLKY